MEYNLGIKIKHLKIWYCHLPFPRILKETLNCLIIFIVPDRILLVERMVVYISQMLQMLQEHSWWIFSLLNGTQYYAGKKYICFTWEPLYEKDKIWVILNIVNTLFSFKCSLLQYMKFHTLYHMLLFHVCLFETVTFTTHSH